MYLLHDTLPQGKRHTDDAQVLQPQCQELCFSFSWMKQKIFFFYCRHNINMLSIFLQSTVSRDYYGGRQGPNNTIS